MSSCCDPTVRAAGEIGFSQHAPADKTPKVDFGYTVTPADAALTRDWSVRITNDSGVPGGRLRPRPGRRPQPRDAQLHEHVHGPVRLTAQQERDVSEEPTSNEQEKPRTGWRALLTLPKAIVATALAAAVTWGVTELFAITSVRDEATARDPVAVSVESNYAQTAAFAGLPVDARLPAGTQPATGAGFVLARGSCHGPASRVAPTPVPTRCRSCYRVAPRGSCSS